NSFIFSLTATLELSETLSCLFRPFWTSEVPGVIITQREKQHPAKQETRMKKTVKKIKGTHGIVCSLGRERNGYFGWPTVARLDDGRLVVASSGLRRWHVCPFGKTVVNFSEDDGRNWSPPLVINNSPLDDRDAGVVNLGSEKIMVTWFTSNTWKYLKGCREKLGEPEIASWSEALKGQCQANLAAWLDCWSLISEDGGKSWVGPFATPCNSPHGPIRLSSGALLYLGKKRIVQEPARPIICARSQDYRNWELLGQVPVAEGTELRNYYEPDIVELPSGRLVGLIRVEQLKREEPDRGLINFSLFQTESEDGGQTWSVARPTGVYGSPPHLLLHSSGVLVCVYGYRRPPYGQRAMFSLDEGQTWDADWIIRDDGPDHDLGYPSSVEMPEGSIITVYYQKLAAEEKCSLLYTRWRLPSF
ncbi:MAG TPA: sialidase family protein, partial [bacterium]|nr:sialidase family protein [bacterium]